MAVSSGDWTGINVVVTGACGGYGAFLARSLVNAGAFVHAIDMRRDDHLNFLARAEAEGKARFINLNLMQEDASPIKDAFVGAKVVFHTVAYFGDPPFALKAFADPGNEDKTRYLNSTMTERVLAIARECGAKAFVCTSSVNTVWPGRCEMVDITEDTPYPDPALYLDAYSMCKAEVERIVIGADGVGGLRTASVRANGIYGPTLRLVAVSKFLLNFGPLRGMWTKFHDKYGKEPVSCWCHAENLALVQMLAAKELLAGNPAVCGSKYAASDGGSKPVSEFFIPFLRGAGWTHCPIVPLPGALMRGIAYALEASCYWMRRLTGSRTYFVPPLTFVELAKATMSNTQSVEKAKRELNYVPLPEEKLMAGMEEFTSQWAKKYATIPAVPYSLWVAVPAGCGAVLALSFMDVRRWGGAPWLFFRGAMAKAAPAVATMQLDVFQRKVFRIGLCLPMAGLHVADGAVAAYLARGRGNCRWLEYGIRTVVLGAGQLHHLLSESALRYYTLICTLAFGASAVVAAKVS